MTVFSLRLLAQLITQGVGGRKAKKVQIFPKIQFLIQFSILAIRSQLNTLKEQELQLRKGLGIFKIDQPPSKEIAALEKV